jgi:putative transposase
MSQKQFTAERIIVLLREADVKLSKGRNLGQICREMGITEQSYYRCRREYGEMKAAQFKRLRDLERENDRSKKAVAELIPDKTILKDAIEGNY